MKFDVEVAGRERSITVERIGDTGRFRIVLNGQAHDVEASPIDLGLSVIFLADGRSLEAAATPGPGGDWRVHLPHRDVWVVGDDRRHVGGRLGAAGGPGLQRVTAPMPGRVLRVLVKPGDQVAHRQGLVVVEARKMENDLTAPKAGVVTEVAITEGTSVEAGRLLVVIE